MAKQREQNETNAGNREAAKGFRRLEAYKRLPVLSELRLQLINPSTSPNELNTTLTPHSIIHGDACFAYFNKIWGTPCRTGGLPMHTIILAVVIALAGLVVIAGGALELSTLEAAEGEMLQVSDYLSGIGTIASGLGMLGLAEALRLLLRITA